MTNVQPPDAMKKLVLVIIGIAILGTVIALGVHYGVELPAQNTMKAPMNLDKAACYSNCYRSFCVPQQGTSDFSSCCAGCSQGCGL